MPTSPYTLRVSRSLDDPLNRQQSEVISDQFNFPSVFAYRTADFTGVNNTGYDVPWQAVKWERPPNLMWFPGNPNFLFAPKDGTYIATASFVIETVPEKQYSEARIWWQDPLAGTNLIVAEARGGVANVTYGGNWAASLAATIAMRKGDSVKSTIYGLGANYTLVAGGVFGYRTNLALTYVRPYPL